MLTQRQKEIYVIHQLGFNKVNVFSSVGNQIHTSYVRIVAFIELNITYNIIVSILVQQ